MKSARRFGWAKRDKKKKKQHERQRKIGEKDTARGGPKSEREGEKEIIAYLRGQTKTNNVDSLFNI